MRLYMKYRQTDSPPVADQLRVQVSANGRMT